MKTIPRHLKAISAVLLSVLSAPFALAQTTPSENSSGAISIDRSAHYTQTDYGEVTLQQSPYVFTFHVRGGAETLKTNWGPKFYVPGSGGVVQSGPTSATNTGTLNFSDAPNSGSDFMFVHEFDTDAAMQYFYPIAPTDGGQYGVQFLGTGAPASEFTDGLVYAADITYPIATPQLLEPTPANANGSFWANGKLHINPSGLTTLKLNTFGEYSSTTYGSLIAVGIYDSSGNVIASPSKTSYYLPVGDSTEDDDPIVQNAITEISLDGSWLTPGVTYTLELQYATIAGRPEEATLASTEFQGVTSYRRVTTISLVASSSGTSDFDGDGQAEVLWRDTATGTIATWTSGNGYAYQHLGSEAGTTWRVVTAADFDGDGQSEVLWRDTASGAVATWTSGNGYAYQHLGSEAGTTWRAVTAADFDGDGQAEVFWRDTATGAVATWTSGNGYAYQHLGSEAGTTWRAVTAADFDGDGRAEVLWRDTATGTIAAWTSGLGYQDFGSESGNSWRAIAAADFDGDGQADVLWRDTTAGTIASWTSSQGYKSYGSEAGNNWKAVGNDD